jgi:hypothetical protein
MRRFFTDTRLAGGLVVAALLLAGCTSGFKVKTDADPGANFSEFRTYDWIVKEAPENLTTLTHKRIIGAVDEQLLDKGFVRSANVAPDMLVNYQVIVGDKSSVTTHSYGYWRGYTSGTMSVSQYAEGTLVVDVIDAGKNRAVWRGWGSAAVGRMPDSSEQQLIRDLTKKMFSKFPPK